MKAKDIKEFELGEHCFGEILRVNGTDYDDLTKEEILELITDMFKNDVNASSLIREAFIYFFHNFFCHIINIGIIFIKCYLIIVTIEVFIHIRKIFFYIT